MGDAEHEYTEVELLDMASDPGASLLTQALALSLLTAKLRKAREQLAAARATTPSASGCARTLRLVPSTVPNPTPTPTSNHEEEQ